MSTDMRYLALIFVLLPLAVGCSHTAPTAAQATGNAIARAQSRNDDIADHAGKIVAATDGGVKVHAESIQADAAAQKKDLADAQGSLNDLAKQLATVLASWAYKIGTFIVRFFVWIIVAVLVAVLLRSAGLVFTGWAGTAASVAGHGILAVATGGVSLIFSLLDNAWFRHIAPTVPPPTQPVVVTTAPATVTSTITADPLPNIAFSSGTITSHLTPDIPPDVSPAIVGAS